MKEYRKVEWRDIPLFREVREDQWNDWRWQLHNVIRDIETLGQVIEIDEEEKESIRQCLQQFKMAITPYYATVMDRTYKLCSVRLQAIPSIKELQDESECLDDPLYEDVDSPVVGLTHRYPDRVLFLVTNVCSMYCRHCTRRRMVGSEDRHLSRENLQQAMDYIRRHSEIRDVLLSGGDPLMLTDESIEEILKELSEINHVEIVRIGTRMPVVLPQRITDSLVGMLRKYQPLYVNTQFNHYKEITHESKEACEKLTDAGIPLGNQSVLLRDVNDCPRIMKKLVHELLMIRVKPYYIYQCDLTRGIGHFRTSISKGIEIIENLRGHTTGLAVPTFVVDAPGGGGKIPLMPNYIVSSSDKRVILRNYEGVITAYTEPGDPYSKCWCELCEANQYEPLDGVAKLLLGDKLCLEPTGLKRTLRHNNGN